MCILTYIPAGIDVDSDALWNGGLNNPDGHGWAIAEGERLYIGKSLSLGEALEGFEKARKLHPGGEALFHSRWATHGSVTPANCHPFYVGNSKMTVVGHNGILPAAAHPAKGDDRSDTKKFAQEILSTRYRRFDKARAMEALTGWIGSYNKLVILTVDPRYRHNAYLVNEKAGNWDQGVWFSNHDWLSTPTWWQSYLAKKDTKAVSGDYADDSVDLCFMCNYGSVNSFGYCNQCKTCQDCVEVQDDCVCYWSGASSKAATQQALTDAMADEYATWDDDTRAGYHGLLSAEEIEDLERAIDRDQERLALPVGNSDIDFSDR